MSVCQLTPVTKKFESDAWPSMPTGYHHPDFLSNLTVATFTAHGIVSVFYLSNLKSLVKYEKVVRL